MFCEHCGQPVIEAVVEVGAGVWAHTDLDQVFDHPAEPRKERDGVDMQPVGALLLYPTAEELEALHQAIQFRILELAKWRDLAKTALIAEPHIHEIGLLQAIDTAVCAAKARLVD